MINAYNNCGWFDLLGLRRLLKIKAMFVIPLVMPNEGTEDRQAAVHGEDGHAIAGTASHRRTHITSTIKSDVRGLVVIKQTKRLAAPVVCAETIQ